MKRYLFGMFAIAIAMACFAFTNKKLDNSCPSQSTNYYWVPVKAGVDILASQCSSARNSLEALASPSTYLGTAAQFSSTGINGKICLGTTYVCAVAFGNSTDFFQVTDPTDPDFGKYKVKADATIICCINRP